MADVYSEAAAKARDDAAEAMMTITVDFQEVVFYRTTIQVPARLVNDPDFGIDDHVADLARKKFDAGEYEHCGQDDWNTTEWDVVEG